MITITERAASALLAAVTRTEGKAIGVRIATEQQGCSSEAGYSIGLVSGGLPEDQQITVPAGVTVFVSEQAAPTLDGAVLDYGETDAGEAFSIFNPHAPAAPGEAASGGCSCGKSSCCSSS